MGTTAQKLQNIIDSKAAISAAIEAKGGTVPTELTGYGPAIEALPSGGSEGSWLLDEQLTYIKDTDGNISHLALTGTLAKNAVDAQALSASKIQLGTDLTAVAGTQNIFNINNLRTRVVSADFPSSIKSIGQSAFWGSWNLHPILHEGLETIANYAFRDCFSGVDDVSAAIIVEQGIDINSLGIEIPSTVKSIGANAFEASVVKQPVIFSPALTSIGSSAFKNCARTAPDGNHRTSLSNVVFQGKTKAQVQSMSNYPWNITTGQGYIHCTDGDI